MSKPAVPLFFAAVLAALLPMAAQAAETSMVFGGDTYAAGDVVAPAEPAAHDAFVAGRTVTLSVPVAGSAHLAGFDVHASGPVGDSVYAMGFTVNVDGAVTNDVTAAGNSVTLKTSAPIKGNARLAGAGVTVGSEVDGSLLVTASTLTLSAPVKGDLSFYGEKIDFGPNAQVAGQVQIHAPAEIAVPASVAPADRVSYAQLSSPQYPKELGQTAETVAKGFWAGLWAALFWWLLLLLAGLAFLAWRPKFVSDLQVLSEVRPFRRFWLGVLALAALVGLVPLTVMTLIGILLLPVVLLFVFIVFSLAYVAGAYLIGMSIARRFTPIETLGRRVAVLAVSLVVAGLLTMVPFVGWLITLIITAYGIGVVSALVMTRWGSSDRARLSGSAPPASPTPA